MLESLWHFAAGYAKRGDVGRFTDEEIASHLEWRGDAAQMVAALVEARWLDRCPCHRLRVHHWKDHADQTVSRSEDVKKRGFLECYDREDLPMLVTTSVSVTPDSQSVPLPLPVPEPMPDPEPVPCAGAPDERRSESVPSTGLTPEEEQEYALEVEKAVAQRRGNDFPVPSNADYVELRRWMTEGIPLRIALRGIQDCSKAPPTIRYAGPAVREAYSMWRRLVPA